MDRRLNWNSFNILEGINGAYHLTSNGSSIHSPLYSVIFFNNNGKIEVLAEATPIYLIEEIVLGHSRRKLEKYIEIHESLIKK